MKSINSLGKIILASKSPRREEILSKINLNLRPQNLPPKFYFNIAKLLEDN